MCRCPTLYTTFDTSSSSSCERPTQKPSRRNLCSIKATLPSIFPTRSGQRILFSIMAYLREPEISRLAHPSTWNPLLQPTGTLSSHRNQKDFTDERVPLCNALFGNQPVSSRFEESNLFRRVPLCNAPPAPAGFLQQAVSFSTLAGWLLR